MAYHEFTDAETGEGYGSFEVFYHDGVRVSEDDCWADDEGEPRPKGWYWWACFPGCMPDSDFPNGPFPTEEDAVRDANLTE